MHGSNILFLCPYPGNEAPSQRFRFEQYFDILEKNGVHIHHAPFFSLSAWLTLYKDGKSLQKAGYILIGFIKRLTILLKLKNYNYIFIHREVSPVGPPFYEWLLTKIFKKKIIYDFDDAIWLKDPDECYLKSWLKCKWKVAKICRWSYKVSAGNAYLANYAIQFNSNVIINPTTIDTDLHRPLPVVNDKLTIGWTGTHSTLQYLETVISILKELKAEYDFNFLIIANKKPRLGFNSFQYMQWKKSTEIEDLNKIDIGIMPLSDDPWSKGKCGFKALQYMALEKPALVSPVGVNKNIVTHEVNGFHCNSPLEWEERIRFLLENHSERRKMGIEGRKTVKKYYSIKSNEDNFLSLFE